MKFTESELETYAQPLSETEDRQCKNAIRMVADALRHLNFTDDGRAIVPLYENTYAYSLQLRESTGNRSIKLFVQGSYANNTNVRGYSDVDIAVIQEEVFRTKFRPTDDPYPQTDADYNFITAPIPPKTFKDEVEECLKEKFGRDVERKNKSIKVHGNTYRKDADTVPCRRYRDYRNDYRNDANNYIGGVVITPDRGAPIINYPEQHIENGRRKNNSTSGYYKKMVRIMKAMRYCMEECSTQRYVSAAEEVSSFMLESLLWNIDVRWYLNNCIFTKVYAFKQMIFYLKRHKNLYRSFKEANGIKPLCADEKAYIKLCNFIDELELFFDYE